ncbi:THO complex subunit 4A-like protein isoform X2 [Cinnamomum micranthum f. kanehirae]|uniref:THO complex subunit 4A-like protein isoform X2 n=1 Tax=Cinnamomum micranthum f. kanehirae TaxID=337451 RepID=A0A3S4P5V5_9MAGN|nr:THO complex subunit 4A-like protein isoform X2 [Cinnamomum micranthum f. kanehirae]
MSSALDMSLDDLIKNNKKSSGSSNNSRGRGRGSGPGPTRRFQNRGSNRPTPYSMGKVTIYTFHFDAFNEARVYACDSFPNLMKSRVLCFDFPIQAPETAWQHDLFADQVGAYSAPQAARASAIETGTKLYISNLDYGVSNEDIKALQELFSEVGDLKRYSIHYDRSGRSKGTAEVVFSRRTDAAAAFKRYNNVQLDGKPMKIEIVGTNIVTPASMPQVSNGAFGNPSAVPRRLLCTKPEAFIHIVCYLYHKVGSDADKACAQGRGGFMGRPRGGGISARGGRGWGRSRGRGRGRGDNVSAEDLDADLEKYHSEAMQIN